MSVYVGPEATSAVKPAERDFGTAALVDDALELLIGADNVLSPRARLGARSADIACQAVRSVNYSK
jgi:hypothetical protein